MLRVFKFTLAIGFAALAFGSTAASAAAIYSWLPVSGLGDPMGGLTITDAAYFAGNASLNYSRTSQTPLSVPETGIVSFNFSLYGTGLGYFDVTPSLFGTYNLAINLLGNGLTGHIGANNDGNHIGLASDADGLWTIFASGADGPSVCHNTNTPACLGQTGRFVLASAPASNVPEPASALLLFSAIGGLTLLRRRSRR